MIRLVLSVGSMAANLKAAIAVLLITLTASPAGGAMRVSYETVLSGLTEPVAVTAAGDGSGRLFLTSKEGLVLAYDGTSLLPTPFLDISDLVSGGGEQGLLSIAFHPGYAANGLFFANYTDLTGATVVARFRVSADPNVADRSSLMVILTVEQPFGNHNGGQLQFGPDGYLYVGMGDGGSAGDPLGAGQDLTTLLGKMLRIDVDGPPPYGIPPDNPFAGNPAARDEIWALGLRNPWRFSFDRVTGELFIGDVGQSSWEEIDYQAAGSGGGQNYGWNLMEGRHCFEPPANCNDGSLVLPVIEYSHDTGCSVTGGYRYRGTAVPPLQGAYLFADFCSGQVWGAVREAGRVKVVELFDSAFRINSFGEDERGEIYFTHFQPPASSSLHRITWAAEAVLSIAAEVSPVVAGGTLQVRARAVNSTHLSQDLVFTTQVVTPSGAEFPAGRPLLGPAAVSLPPFSEHSAVLSHAVPPQAPAGTYAYRATLSRNGKEVAAAEGLFEIRRP